MSRVVITLARLDARERASYRCGLAAGTAYGMGAGIGARWDEHGWSLHLTVFTCIALALLIYSIFGMPPKATVAS